MVTNTYRLEQQTPMIHFQSGEDGATLRASEVKPKLDRFIIAQCERKGESVPDKWHLNPERHKDGAQKDRVIKPALNYKLRFAVAGNSKIAIPPYSIFYANMGEERKKDQLKMVIGNCAMTIICFIPALANEIEKSLADFFIASTFGFMQGKGFGGYTLGERRPSQSQIAGALQSVLGCGKVYAALTKLPAVIVEKTQQNGKWKVPPNAFDNIIKPFHSLMKSGINFGGYERSYLFQYFHKKLAGYGNDKAFVKSKGIAPVVYKRANAGKGEHAHSFSNHKYIRALLGIAEKIEYIHALDQNDRPVKNSESKITKDVITIKSIDDIERYASPVRYRVIDDHVYIFAVPIPGKLHGSRFTFTSSADSGTIPVPDKNDFDIEDFLSAFVKHINTDAGARAVAKFKYEKFEEVSPNA